MAQRKPWSQLNPSYRARLESKGITQKDFESGASIAKARGHEKTPERPVGFDPAKYPGYTSRRQQLIDEVKQKKEEFFGSRPRWNAERSDRAIRDKPPTMAQLRWAAHPDRTEEDFVHEIREDPAKWRFLGYG
jgi:hypothetical protein